MSLLSDLRLSCSQPEPTFGTYPTSYVVPTKIFRASHFISEACGKGLDWQAWASGLYEALEHAAMAYRLPGQSPAYFNEILPYSELEDVDLIYKYARRIRPDSPQPVVEFREFETGRRVLYPAVAADFGYEITSKNHDLGYLDRTSTTKGYAAGSNQWEAETHALNELIEYDALSEYLLSSVTIGGKDPVGVSVNSWPPAKSVLETLKEAGAHDLIVARLPSLVSEVVLVWCRSIVESTVIGIGCSLHADVAVMRALTEAHQELVAD